MLWINLYMSNRSLIILRFSNEFKPSISSRFKYDENLIPRLRHAFLVKDLWTDSILFMFFNKYGDQTGVLYSSFGLIGFVQV